MTNDLSEKHNQEILKTIEDIRREEDQLSLQKFVMEEIERKPDGYFYFYCGVCEKQYRTRNYKQYYCSKKCKEKFNLLKEE